MGATRRTAVWAARGLALLCVVVAAGGCRGRAEGVPEGAKFEKVSKRRIAYTAPQDGTVYVVDDWDNQLLYSGPVRQGDEVVVDPGAGVLSVAGKEVSPQRKLHSGDHSIYLLRGEAVR